MQLQGDARFAATLPVTISGVDDRGFRFKQTAQTRDVSRRGARLSGIPMVVEPASLLEIQYRRRKARFRVVWAGNPDAAPVREAGVVCVDGSACLWGQPLPGRLKPRRVPGPQGTQMPPEVPAIASGSFADTPRTQHHGPTRLYATAEPPWFWRAKDLSTSTWLPVGELADSERDARVLATAWAIGTRRITREAELHWQHMK